MDKGAAFAVGELLEAGKKEDQVAAAKSRRSRVNERSAINPSRRKKAELVEEPLSREAKVTPDSTEVKPGEQQKRRRSRASQ